MLFLLAISTLTLAFQIPSVKADDVTITINADGSVTPSTAPISTLDNVTYTLTGNITTDVGDGILVERDNIVVNGAGYTVAGSRSGNGTTLTSMNNVTVTNITITNFDYGIVLNSSSGNVLSGNTLTANDWCGIFLESSSGNTLSDNSIANNYGGISLDSSSGNTLSSNKVTDGSYGIDLSSSSDNNVLLGNNVTANGMLGITLDSSCSNAFSGNVMEGNLWNFGVFGNGLTDYLESVDTSNLVDGEPVYYFVNQSDLLVNADAYPEVGYLGFVNCSNVTVQGLDLKNNVQGLLLAFTNDSTINGINAANNGEGIELDYSFGNSLSGSNFTNNMVGIELYSCSDNIVSSNNVTANEWSGLGFGIELDESSGNKIFHNNFVDNVMQVGPDSSGNTWDDGYPSGGNYWSDYNGTDVSSGPYQNLTGSDGIGDTPYVIDARNRDNYPLMKPYVPFENQTIYIRADGSIDPSGAPVLRQGNIYTLISNVTSNADGIVIERDNITLDGAGFTVQGNGAGNGISLSGLSGVTIENANIENFGIYLVDSSNNNIRGNDITANTCITLDSSSGNSISGNNITNNGGWGIKLGSSSNNTVSENNIANIFTGIPWEPWFGIWLAGSSFNTLSQNDIANEIQGVSLMNFPASVADGSSFNTVSENNITDNEYGIVLGIWWSDYMTIGNCSNNAISHNNFIGNYQQVLSGSSTNVWDNGYPSGGNYWSDYNGTDVRQGPYQNETGDDGIGDTPYVIDATNLDNYPLMNPFGPLDITVTSLTSAKTVIGQGYTGLVDVTFENLGNKIEAFNATVCANATCIFSEQITLAMTNCTVSFVWNTTGFGYGNYAISAYALPVPDETNAAKNFTEANAIVAIPGDIDGNGRVDMNDIVSLCTAFGSTLGQPKYVPNCDVDNNGKIDMNDIIIALRNFGQHIIIITPY